MSRLGGAVARERDVVSFLLGLVEEAIDRLTCDDNSERPVILLPQLVADTPGETTIKVKDIAIFMWGKSVDGNEQQCCKLTVHIMRATVIQKSMT